MVCSLASADAFAATQSLEQKMCDASVRNNSAVPRESNWPLFGIALFSIISRFLARSPLLKGPGYGWDDWSILVGFGLLVAANGLLDRSAFLTITWSESSD